MIARHLASRRLAAASVVVVSGIALSGCHATAAATVAPQAISLPATACDGTTLTGDVDVSMLSGGEHRSMIVHIPSGYTDRTPVPLVLNLHGSGSTAAVQEEFSGMDSVADAHGFLVAYPQGAIVSGSGDDWNVPGEPLFGGGSAPANAPDDVAFLAQAIHTLEQGLCVDSTRVDATGFSGGARMTSELGCDLSTTIAAIAPVSGLRFPSPCVGTRPVPVISFHGTDDPVDPYNGNGQAYWTYSVAVAVERWAVHDACATTPDESVTDSTVRFTEYTGCADGATVGLYTIDGEGHEWPGGPRLPAGDTRILGPQSDAMNADATMWQFFMVHPLSTTP